MQQDAVCRARPIVECIGIAKEKLIFHPMHIGGDFGGKGDFMDVPWLISCPRRAASR